VQRRWTIRALWLLGCALVLLFAVKETAERRRGAANISQERTRFINESAAREDELNHAPRGPSVVEPETPAQSVARRLSQFGAQRRTITYDLAAKYGVTIDPEVAEFYAAIEANDWHGITNKFTSIWKRKDSDDPAAAGLRQLAAPMLETFGAAEQVHDWPPEKLLEYGHAILDSLKPGMVYIGGTDSGRFIPTLLNDTEPDSERHIVITQNALADRGYAEYFQHLYGDQIAGLDQGDSDKAFQTYIDDARKRFEHDRDFPNDPKQVRKGEDIKIVDGKTQVSGQVAVMDINERLLNRFIEKNPNFTFAMEESFPLNSTYSAAHPLGPIFEINAKEGGDALTATSANDAMNYWRKTAREIADDPVSSNSMEALKTYSHMVNAQGNFFANRDYSAQSEEAYRLALQLWPGNVEAATGLSSLLEKNGRADEGKRVLDEFNRVNPRIGSTYEDNFKVTHSGAKK